MIRHDLSWGTKGSDSSPAVDLGFVQGVGDQVEVELVSAQQDIDIAYQDALDNLRVKETNLKQEHPRVKMELTEQQQKDIYVSRPKMVLSQRTNPRANRRTSERMSVTFCYVRAKLKIAKLLLCWALSNALLASLILSSGDPANAFNNTGTNRSAIYMLIVLGEAFRSLKSRQN